MPLSILSSLSTCSVHRNLKEADVDVPVSKYEAAVGYPYEGFLIPFAAPVWCKDLDKQGFEPNNSPAIYLSPEVVAGMRYKATHRVFPLKRVKQGIFRAAWTSVAQWRLGLPTDRNEIRRWPKGH